MIEFTKAMIEVQKEIRDVSKDSTNPHFKSSYASLESVLHEALRVLLKHGFTFSHIYDGMNLKLVMRHVSGQSVESVCPLILSKNDMQGLGSATTYMRRYSLAAMLGIGQADDDANDACKTHIEARQPVKQAVTPQWTKEQMKEFSIAKWNVADGGNLSDDQKTLLAALSKTKPFRVAMNDLQEDVK